MPIRPYAAARLSPDGSRVAVQIDDGDNDIWVWDLGRETLTRVTTDAGVDHAPLWMPDGQRLIFTRGNTTGALFWQAADGSGAGGAPDREFDHQACDLGSQRQQRCFCTRMWPT